MVDAKKMYKLTRKWHGETGESCQVIICGSMLTPGRAKVYKVANREPKALVTKALK